MTLSEYAALDGLGLAALIKAKELSAREATALAFQAIEKVNPRLNAVVETYDDRRSAEGLEKGAFYGVPMLMKDVFGHEAGRKMEFGSRLCEGMITPYDSYLLKNFKRAGVNIIGRSAAPEYSMSGTTEGLLYGNTSNPFKHGYSAGGSSGGSAAAVSAGLVPLAHGSDIGGSIRIPASYCGGVGFKPSRGRVSVGPTVDEGGWGYSSNHVQTKSLRDSAAMLDIVSAPQLGDPFVIPKPSTSYLKLLEKAPKPLKIGIVFDEFFGVKIDDEVKQAVLKTGKLLEAMGHKVEMASASMGRDDTYERICEMFFYGFNLRLDGYGARVGRKPSPDNLEAGIWLQYEKAKHIGAGQFFNAVSAMNQVRRSLAKFWGDYDIWLSPATAEVSSAWGRYHLSSAVVENNQYGFEIPIQCTMPHNIMGSPAISLPLFMHSQGLPIGVQLAAAPSLDHVVLQLSRQLEIAMPWSSRSNASREQFQ